MRSKSNSNSASSSNKNKPLASPNFQFAFYLIVFVIGALLAFVVIPLIFERDYSPSAILRDMVNYANSTETKDLSIQTERLLTEDPFSDLIERHIQPAWEEVTKIKQETAVYEKIQKVPGGSEKFMTSALESLSKISSRLPAFENQYRLICENKANEFNSLLEVYKRSLREFNTIFDDHSLEILEKKQIYLDEPTETLRRNHRKPFSKIIELMSSISNLLFQLEKLEARLKNIMSQEIDRESSSAKDDASLVDMASPAVPLSDEITKLELNLDDVIRKEGHLLRLVIPTLSKLDHSFNRIGQNQKDRKMRYEKIVDALEADVVKTKWRIDNLKYIGSKAEHEL